MVAKTMVGKFILAEVGFNLLYLLVAFVLMNVNGIVGLTQGYLVAYVLYTIVMIIIFRNIIIVKKQV